MYKSPDKIHRSLISAGILNLYLLQWHSTMPITSIEIERVLWQKQVNSINPYRYRNLIE